LPLDAALIRPFIGYKLFTGAHTTVSVFPLAREKKPYLTVRGLKSLAFRGMPGFAVSFATERCYAATVDCAEVVNRFCGVPESKIDICPLGVDTELFQPAKSELDQQRSHIRNTFGFAENEIVCIYTGRFTEGKNPLVLAEAVSRLISLGMPYRALFLGDGPQAESIQRCVGCSTHPFVPIKELAAYFRSAEIGVWPREESMSMLDAAACGLPIVVNDSLAATERIDGNGLTYKKDDVGDLVQVLLSLGSGEKRLSLGRKGVEKMQKEFSWEAIARRRLCDYEMSLKGHSR
jgi:glycosyltransferase involved in cell wall biosynthesis